MRGYHHRRTRLEFEWGSQLAVVLQWAIKDKGITNARAAQLLGITMHSKLIDDMAMLRRGEPCSIGRMIDLADVLRLPIWRTSPAAASFCSTRSMPEC